ncbi:hypothetical protein EVAR_62855_1 [Eumeta japonica]|uniref:Uncharacterized protein n=1 Tax=Eumeta variegata TaxID=151549 RepID=A0A4C2A3H8_EUMVA|nr:hypothetical protein EVAR_62855_1 [Eumeta japonica]
MGLRRLITEFLWPPSSSIIRPWLPYSIKVLVKTNQTSPNSMGLRRLITEFLWPPSAPSSDADYHIVSKYSSRGIKRAQTRWAPSSDADYHIVSKYSSRGIKRAQTRRRLITEFLWPPSSSIIRPWLPYSIKVLVKTNQTSPNSMGLRRLITEFLWPPSSSIIRR